MFDFMDQVASGILFAIQFLGNILASLGNALVFLLEAILLPQSFIGLVHPVIGSAILITIAIGVIKFIIGR